VRSAPAHGVAPERAQQRAQLSVAELLGRDGNRPSGRTGPVEMPETWPLPVGSSRLRLARTAGAYLVAGSVVCAAAFGGHSTDGPTMGASTPDGGPPTGALTDTPEPETLPEQPRPTASDRYIAPKPPRVQPAARVAPAAPRPVRRIAPPRHRAPVQHRDPEDLRVPAGSALSSLTRPIVGSDSILGPLG
jgi:hypothetical protein